MAGFQQFAGDSLTFFANLCAKVVLQHVQNSIPPADPLLSRFAAGYDSYKHRQGEGAKQHRRGDHNLTPAETKHLRVLLYSSGRNNISPLWQHNGLSQIWRMMII
jgi:hypothetical protein